VSDGQEDSLMRLTRFAVLLSPMLAHAGCADSPRHPVRALADGANMRAVMGEAVTVAPLTPEPGDIWADLDFLKRSADSAPAATPQVRLPEPAMTRTPKEADRPVVAAYRRFYVQLAAAKSENAARGEWQQLRRRMPDLIDGREAVVTAAEVGGQPQWRLRTGGFATRDDATVFCNQLKSRHSECWVVADAS